MSVNKPMNHETLLFQLCVSVNKRMNHRVALFQLCVSVNGSVNYKMSFSSASICYGWRQCIWCLIILWWHDISQRSAFYDTFKNNSKQANFRWQTYSINSINYGPMSHCLHLYFKYLWRSRKHPENTGQNDAHVQLTQAIWFPIGRIVWLCVLKATWAMHIIILLDVHVSE